jgi:hypothetical protein
MRVFLRRVRASRAVFALAVLGLGSAVLIGATAAIAGPAITETTPFSGMFDNPCTGELLAVTGQQHIDINENFSSDGTLQSHVNYRLDGVTAVGVTSGARYVVQDTENHEFVFSGFSGEDTFDMTAHFVRLGETGTLILGDDFYETFKTHITTNATGQTAFHYDFIPQACR